MLALAVGSNGTSVAATFTCSQTGERGWVVPDALFGANALGRPKYYGNKRVNALFARYAVTLTSDPPDTVNLVDDRNVYGAPGTVDNSLAWAAMGLKPTGASLWHNVIVQGGGNKRVSFTLVFSTPVKRVRFIRAGLIAGGQGVTHPEWSAFGKDARGRVVAKVHEALIATYSGVPARAFELAGDAPITSVTFAGNNHAFAAFSNVVVQLIGWCR